MEFGKNIGINPIKLNEKNTTKEIDEILHRVNDIFYEFNCLYITQEVKDSILAKLVELGQDLNNIVCPIVKSERRNELRKKMQEAYKQIRKYYPTTVWGDAVTKITDSNRYLVSQFLREKKDGLTDTIALKWIKKIKLLDDYGFGITKNLNSVMEECLKHFKINKIFDNYLD